MIVNAQTNKEIKIDKLTTDFIKELQSRKIDTICIYENYCVGEGPKTYEPSLHENKPFCIEEFPNDPVYVLWKENGKNYLTKISICFEYSKTTVPTHDFWNIYFSNEKVIKKEEIKPFEYRPQSNNGKLKYMTMVDHSCHQNFRILINKKIIDKNFDDFNLQEKNNHEININYTHNKNLKSKFIIDDLKKVTSGTELEIYSQR